MDALGDAANGDSSHSPASERLRAYKNNSLDPGELRRRREEEGMQLRRQKKAELLRKRRNLADANAAAPPLPSAVPGASGGVQDPSVSSSVEVSAHVRPAGDRVSRLDLPLSA